jgi:tetratricopeptide (TPR) repeat protein
MEEAVEQYQRAKAIMPLSPAVTLRLVHALYLSGDEEEADRITSDMLKIWPDAIALRQVRLKSALWTKRYDEALAMLEEKGLHLTRAQSDALRATFEALRSGDSAAKASAAATLTAMSHDVRRNDRLVVAGLAALGANDAAIDAAQRLIRERGHPLADVLFEPNLAAASTSPRYGSLVTGLGLADYWRRSRSLPDICGDQAKATFCTVS